MPEGRAMIFYRGLLAALMWASISGMCWGPEGMWQPRLQPQPNEAWIDANHLQVAVGGVAREVHLMPLADHLCRTPRALFERYCMPAAR